MFGANAVDHSPSSPSSTLDQDFDLLGRVIHATSVDAGESFLFLDAAEQLAWHKEPRGAISVTDYDELHRPSKRTVTPPSGHAAFVSERYVYGEDGSAGGSADNQLGRLFRLFDQAGKVTYTYDFKGNVATSSRQLVANIGHQTAVMPSTISPTYLQVADWAAASPNYTAPVDAAFDPLVTTTSYDALNRPVEGHLPARDPLASLQSPPETPATPNVLAYSYDEGGHLKRVTARPYRAGSYTTVVDSITYNEKHQRLKLTLGSGTYTDYSYSPLTFRLTQLVTTKSGGAKLQDLKYTYDAVGNIVQITDAAQSTLYFNNAAVGPTALYEYDTLYRLVSASGREHSSAGVATEVDFTPSGTLPDDGTALKAYTETYAYDLGGNIKSLAHAATGNNWTRTYVYPADAGDHTGNRLTSTTVGGTTLTYTHDLAGNLTVMPHLPAMAWDERQQLVQATKGSRDASSSPVLRLQHDNHLGTACVETDGGEAVISYEEFFPYGATSYRAGTGVAQTSLKRYRYTGKERDEETGLYYHGARYYVPWLGRWTSADPAGLTDHLNLYVYCRSNPFRHNDSTGKDSEDKTAVKPKVVVTEQSRLGLLRGPYGPAAAKTTPQLDVQGEVYKDPKGQWRIRLTKAELTLTKSVNPNLRWPDNKMPDPRDGGNITKENWRDAVKALEHPTDKYKWYTMEGLQAHETVHADAAKEPFLREWPTIEKRLEAKPIGSATAMTPAQAESAKEQALEKFRTDWYKDHAEPARPDKEERAAQAKEVEANRPMIEKIKAYAKAKGWTGGP